MAVSRWPEADFSLAHSVIQGGRFGDSFLPRMKHGLNTDQDRRQGIGTEEEGEEAADGNAGQQLFFTDKTRSQQEVRAVPSAV